jgi:hypothetical protein
VNGDDLFWAEVAFFPAERYRAEFDVERDGWVLSILDEHGDFS